MSTATIGGKSIRQVISGQQARVIVAVVCAASVMGATSARAQDDRRTPVSRTVTDEQNAPFGDNDPCIGGALVAGVGNQHTLFIDRSTAKMVDTTFRISQDGEGLNTTNTSDKREYRFASSGDTNIKSSTKNYTFTMKTREHIIQEGHDGRGPDKDDYFVYTTSILSGLAPKPVFSRQTADSTCK
jgi:hypothetical protein